ncbi:hypothetical protein TrRE_jg3798 [Triparma retinervis]|uniref:Uncharacterized protein n=1 Tax=Triparma retinervis TaxID=2557542 RepID=A0A9W7CB21_9STRA|nr:hypothetical protein TrRE_jg3798 [Triparma retinervis]
MSGLQPVASKGSVQGLTCWFDGSLCCCYKRNCGVEEEVSEEREEGDAKEKEEEDADPDHADGAHLDGTDKVQDDIGGQ